MGAGTFSLFVAGSLHWLAIISIVCNIILFFPGWSVKYAQDGSITKEVKYMGGLIGGGLLVLAPTLFIQLTGQKGCCANTCGMFLSVAFAALGVAGALYSFVVAVLGLINGPYCRYALVFWGTPFKDKSESYLTHRDWWGICTEPKNVVEFNVGLFSTLLVVSGLQVILCASQMINNLFGCFHRIGQTCLLSCLRRRSQRQLYTRSTAILRKK